MSTDEIGETIEQLFDFPYLLVLHRKYRNCFLTTNSFLLLDRVLHFRFWKKYFVYIFCDLSSISDLHLFPTGMHMKYMVIFKDILVLTLDK